MYYCQSPESGLEPCRKSIQDTLEMKFLALAVASTLLVACSSSPTTKSADSAEEKVYRTGSHVPVKERTDGSTSVTNANAPTPGMPAPYIPGKGGGQ